MKWAKGIWKGKESNVYEVVRIDKTTNTVIIKERVNIMTKLGRALIKGLKEALAYAKMVSSGRSPDEAAKSLGMRVTVRKSGDNSNRPRSGKRNLVRRHARKKRSRRSRVPE